MFVDSKEKRYKKVELEHLENDSITDEEKKTIASSPCYANVHKDFSF